MPTERQSTSKSCCTTPAFFFPTKGSCTKPSPWTRISARVSQSQAESTNASKETASSFAARSRESARVPGENRAVPSQYAGSPSHSTAFVVAWNIELEFSGDTLGAGAFAGITEAQGLPTASRLEAVKVQTQLNTSIIYVCRLLYPGARANGSVEV
ncbi:hypothetical protein N7466_011271 [Penicillium verhagenii]|uniref:uncharacterized protein n=1 Tax=Penicillium verhagenii TaxID=1562060 RepID=UPI002545709F|nr:uncharacterized protein N7466_011662 [Penicillium verhagenii]XP_057016392.1 uncharacterized protein N7466_011271 [Penicillium verhagenii]KAJ5915729.1 hypothetical protein N7466_011662 [Penicillium verhagenii]KAJ5917717.1 hypothetical protein N7466_011271 [Penicillium verhagenii]